RGRARLRASAPGRPPDLADRTGHSAPRRRGDAGREPPRRRPGAPPRGLKRAFERGSRGIRGRWPGRANSRMAGAMALTFYYSPQSNATRVYITLAELGIPHETVFVDLRAGEQKKPEFLALNPNGKVPTIV